MNQRILFAVTAALLVDCGSSSGGGCDPNSCDADCKAGGSAGGGCDASGGCSCY